MCWRVLCAPCWRDFMLPPSQRACCFGFNSKRCRRAHAVSLWRWLVACAKVCGAPCSQFVYRVQQWIAHARSTHCGRYSYTELANFARTLCVVKLCSKFQKNFNFRRISQLCCIVSTPWHLSSIKFELYFYLFCLPNFSLLVKVVRLVFYLRKCVCGFVGEN